VRELQRDVVLISSPPNRCESSHWLTQAAGLLNQQTWCWGRDIVRPEGNWLVTLGFERLSPPHERKGCSSVYFLELGRGRCVVLRGFGVFFGDSNRGGVFLPRYEFAPRYTLQSTLDCPPWSDADLPQLRLPTAENRYRCASLLLDLIDWIREYEVDVVQKLGLSYRRAVLTKWSNGRRPFIPAEQFASAWRELSFRVAGNFDAFVSAEVK
jgi:hypothetical protein